MTTCDDPYREVELYLEKAQEEIGRAVKELEEHEDGILYDDFKVKPSNEILIPPPSSFRCNNNKFNAESSNYCSLNRVCYDGNVQEFPGSSGKVSFHNQHFPSRSSFVSSFNRGIGNNGRVTYSPNTRRRLWQMHPSISFPETSKDLMSLGKEPSMSSYEPTLWVDNTFTVEENQLKNHQQIRYRQRSNSDTVAPLLYNDVPEHSFSFPRPPSGDVNLLSIWADNLVLELDKSLSGELLNNSLESFSPSSDYSLSPNKQDDNLEGIDYCLKAENEDQFQPTQSNSLSLAGKNLKTVSRSSDSGIEQTTCDTPEILEDCVDSSIAPTQQLAENNCNLLMTNTEAEKLNTPKTEPNDGQKVLNNTQSTQTNKTFRRRSGSLKSAELVIEHQETTENMKNLNHIPGAQITLSETIEELTCYPLVQQALCAVNEVQTVKTNVTERCMEQNSSINNSDILDSVISKINGSTHSSTLPKLPKGFESNTDKFRTLPSNGVKNPSASIPQRSASQSAVNYVSIDELTDFIRKVKNGCYYPPSNVDASTDIQNDKDNKDAVTQTTPVPLSRSSSFTCVTECDCSDLDSHNAISGSVESLALSGCSDCKVENGDCFASSSPGESSEDCESPRPGSGSSSLYLSACSGSSDSFEEQTVLNDAINSAPALLVDDVFLPSTHNRSYRSSESTLRGSVLGDITEEQIASETVSVKSNLSNPSLLDNNAADVLEQPASVPSTLKMGRKFKSTGSPEQPIEPTVLVINGTKSVSAPVLLRQKRYNLKPSLGSSSSESSPPSASRNNPLNGTDQVPARSHSAKELHGMCRGNQRDYAEQRLLELEIQLQAIEACSWLRAAGFPQYAQMYEDNQFPIDISIVEKDHSFLHPDSIQSLFRRLNSLNRCAKMKGVDHGHRRSLHVDDSDEEEQFALSENWEFQRSSRRWSRIPSPGDDESEQAPNIPTENSNPPEQSAMTRPPAMGQYLSPEDTYCSSHDSVYVHDRQHVGSDVTQHAPMKPTEKIMLSPSGHIGDCSPGSSSGSGTISVASEETKDLKELRSLRRSGSDRVKDGAKALLKRMESLKGRRKKKSKMTNKVGKGSVSCNGTDGSSSSSLASSPQFRRSSRLDVLHPDMHLGALLKVNDVIAHTNVEDVGAYSDSELRSSSSQSLTGNYSGGKQFQYMAAGTSVTITAPADDIQMNQYEESKKNKVGNGSLKRNLPCPTVGPNQGNRGSFYDNVTAPIVVFNDVFIDCYDENSCKDAAKGEASGIDPSFYQNQEDGDIIVINTERRDSGVGSSLTRGATYQQTPWHCFTHHCAPDPKMLSSPVSMNDLTAPQIVLLKQLALLKLTTVMEKFSPSNKTGWSWGVSKFILGKIRTPDYKDKVAFGVPLLLVQQRTGQPLPEAIQAAMQHLRRTALDATGLFRKSGVRSRIQNMKAANEAKEKHVYEDQQAYDVADMIKLYFRELPEVLLTNKLSESFISLFLHVPEESRLESIQAALLLMPDENREVLQALLEFLHDVCQHSEINQMTPTNLAVCFAPSLFHMGTQRSSSSSPRRRKTVGIPDLRELNENRAGYESLACMVTNFKNVFGVPAEMIAQSRISSALQYHPATLDDLSSYVFNGQSGWKGFIENCIQIFLKEAKDKYKGWKTISHSDHVDLAYKKVIDEYPLKLWKVSTEIEAPPVELLSKVLRERDLWDTSFLRGRVLRRLDKNTEVFQYLTSNLSPRPQNDHVVLRSWRTDLPKGACVLIETSVEYPEAEVIPDSIRSLVMASRYLIEPCGSGKSRITYISRIDTKGRSPEWYNKAYGQLCALFLSKLRNSFLRAGAEGPETKV